MTEKTIGQLAEFLGISTHTIKYYEKQGLISSVRDEKSNYRYYDVPVCTDIYECIKYRNMGFSIKESKFLLNEASSDDVDNMIINRLNEINTQIEELKSIAGNIESYHKELMVLNERLDQWYIEPMNPVYIYYQTDDFQYIPEKSVTNSSLDFSKHFPNTKNVMHIPKESLNGGNLKFEWGVSLKDEYIEESIDLSNLIKVESKRVFVTYKKYDVPYIPNLKKILKELKNIYSNYSEKFVNDAYFFRIKNAYENGKEVEYFKVCVII